VVANTEVTFRAARGDCHESDDVRVRRRPGTIAKGGRADQIDNRPWTLLDINILVLLSSAIMDKPSFDPLDVGQDNVPLATLALPALRSFRLRISWFHLLQVQLGH